MKNLITLFGKAFSVFVAHTSIFSTIYLALLQIKVCLKTHWITFQDSINLNEISTSIDFKKSKHLIVFRLWYKHQKENYFSSVSDFCISLYILFIRYLKRRKKCKYNSSVFEDFFISIFVGKIYTLSKKKNIFLWFLHCLFVDDIVHERGKNVLEYIRQCIGNICC